MRRLTTRVLAALAGATVLLVAGAAPASAAPALTAEPSTDLVDGQTITVRGSGYPANVGVAVIQCGPGGEVGIDDCEINGFRSATTDASGSFSVVYDVRRIIETSRDGRIDCATAPAGTCVVGANQFGSGPTASTPLAFDPDVPPLPDLEVTVEFVSASVEDNVVRLQGVVRCNRPSTVFLDGRVRQVVRRAFIDGNFSTEARCEGEDPFAIVFEGRTGELRRGPAELRIEAFGFDDVGRDTDQFTLEQEIRLEPK